MVNKMKPTYHANCTFEDSWWIVRGVEQPGAITQARSLAEAQERIEEAYLLMVDESDFDVILEPQGFDDVRQFREDRSRQEKLAEHNRHELQKLVVTLRKTLTVRDVAKLLGISYQRVSQIEHTAKAKPKKPQVRKRRKVAA